MELTHNQTEYLVQRFPKLELSYETFAHKKVSSTYDVCISIPNGKKQFAWFTYYGDADVCYLLDVNKDHKVTKAVKVVADFHHKLAYETILYGSLCDIDERQVFIIEDIYYYCGLNVKQFTFGEKLTYLHTVLSSYIFNKTSTVIFALPYMCLVTGDNKLLDSLQFYESMITKTAYVTHHVQFRSSNTISPYLNHTYKKKQELAAVYEPDVNLFPRTDLDYVSQSSLKNAVFRVTADIQNDIYHLFANDPKTNTYTYVNIAYIGTRQLSVYMNDRFRNIRENKNVDYGEESEDEDTFQNVNPDKYVDLKKEYKMHCVFHNKFKKWVPVNTVDADAKCVNIGDLMKKSFHNNGNNSYNSKPSTPYNNKPYNNNTYSNIPKNKPYNNNTYSNTPYSNTHGNKPYSNTHGNKPYSNTPYSNTPYSNTPYSNTPGNKPYNNNYSNTPGNKPYNNNYSNTPRNKHYNPM